MKPYRAAWRRSRPDAVARFEDSDVWVIIMVHLDTVAPLLPAQEFDGATKDKRYPARWLALLAHEVHEELL